MQTLGEYHELKSNMLENEEYIIGNIKEDNPEKKETKSLIGLCLTKSLQALSIQLFTPSVRKYKAIRSKNPKNIELRKNNITSRSTQSKEEFPCALCWDSLKLRGSRVFT